MSSYDTKGNPYSRDIDSALDAFEKHLNDGDSINLAKSKSMGSTGSYLMARCMATERYLDLLNKYLANRPPGQGHGMVYVREASGKLRCLKKERPTKKRNPWQFRS